MWIRGMKWPVVFNAGKTQIFFFIGVVQGMELHENEKD